METGNGCTKISELCDSREEFESDSDSSNEETQKDSHFCDPATNEILCYPLDTEMVYKILPDDTTVADTFRFGTVRLFPLYYKKMESIPTVDNQNIVSLYGIMVTPNIENSPFSYLFEYLPNGTLATNLTDGKNVTVGLLTTWLLQVARGLSYLCSNHIPYGSLDLEKIFITGSRAKIEHPLLVESKKLSFLDGFLNFNHIMENSLNLWKNKTSESKSLYLDYLATTMRKFSHTFMKTTDEKTERDAQYILTRVIAVLSEMTLGESIIIYRGNVPTVLETVDSGSDYRAKVLSFKEYLLLLSSKQANDAIFSQSTDNAAHRRMATNFAGRGTRMECLGNTVSTNAEESTKQLLSHKRIGFTYNIPAVTADSPYSAYTDALTDENESRKRAMNEEYNDYGYLELPRSVLYDMNLPLEIGELPEADDIIMEDGEEPDLISMNGALGEVRPLQIQDENGQGLYFDAFTEGYGHVLIKYLGTRFYRQLEEKYGNWRIPPEGAVEWANAQRVRPREILFASELIHPNIAKILAFITPTGRREDINALVMEGAPVGVLENFSRRHPLSDQLVKQFGLELASALEYCHDKRVIHRDVRPRNVYVHADDGGLIVKLGNFGHARKNNAELFAANRGDELWYKAPEMISSGPLATYSYPVDVYSFGLVLWSMSHGGRRPFVDEGVIVTNDSVFKQHLEVEEENGGDANRPTIRPDLDPSLATLMRRCWVTLRELGPTRPTMTEIVEVLQ